MTSISPLSDQQSRSLMWQTAFVFILALGVRWLGVSSNPVHVDELYHLLAGRSWAEEGTFRMLDGEYLRGRGFTAMTGYAFALIGRSDLFVARLPSIIAGALLVSALFVWMARHTSLRAAWIGAMLFCFASYAIVYTQFTRFYALQAWLVWLGAIAVYGALATSSSRYRLLLMSLGALIAFAAALHLQVTTVIALLALMLWAMTDLAARPTVREIGKRIWRKGSSRALLLAGLLLAAVLLGMFSGALIHQFRFTPRWAAPDQNNFLYYFLEFFFSMPLLWLFLPLAAVLAIARWPRPAWFCIVMTVIPLLLQSAGGMKSSRYVFYAMPFMFALWGMAVSVLMPLIWKAVLEGVDALQQILRCHLGKGAYALAGVLMVMILASAIIAQPIYRDTIKSLRKDGIATLRNPARLVSPPPDPPWSDQMAAVRQAIGQPSILMVGDDFHAIYYLHDFDLLINTHRTEDIPPKGEFVLDPRTGRKAISTPENIAAVIECYSDGAIVVSDSRWRTYIGVSNRAADAIERLAEPVSPAIPGFHIYKWHGQVAGDGCDKVRALATGHRI